MATDKVGLDDFLVALGPDAFQEIIKKAIVPMDEEKSEQKSQALRCISLVSTAAELFHDEAETPYIRTLEGQIYRCTGRAFKRWVSRLFYQSENKPINATSLAEGCQVIEALAVLEGQRYELSNRVAEKDGVIWYDLGDGRALRITPDGWEIIAEPPILFSRYEHQRPQVEPVSGGDIQRIFDFVSIKNSNVRLLFLAWLVSCFVPDIPHAVLLLYGPQGAGKSSLFRIIRRIADPSLLEGMALPRDQNELIQKMSHHWTCLFDNVDGLPPWQSDALCRAVTGEGSSKRQLYTDDDDIVYCFRRVIGLNGINIAATRPDLLDRSILIELERIDGGQRREESELETAFQDARPHILGGILGVLSRAMKIKPSIQLTHRPRMADFARWGCAIAEALGHTTDEFLRAYGTNIRTQNAEVLDSHPVAGAIMALMQGRDEWEGEPSELLGVLEEVAEREKINTRAKTWPGAAHILTRRIKEVQANLRVAKIQIDMGHSGRRRLSIYKERAVASVPHIASSTIKNNDLSPYAMVDATESTASSVQSAPNGNSFPINDLDATDTLDATARPTTERDNLKRIEL
jgi:hypothetical protein